MSARTARIARRAHRATLTKNLRKTTRQNRLNSGLKRRQDRLVLSCKRRPRSLATHALAAGVAREDVAGFAAGMRSKAKKLGIKPVLKTRTRRSVESGRGRKSHKVFRYTVAQVQKINEAYTPRKAEYKVAKALLALAA
jgi:hypothetical protein